MSCRVCGRDDGHYIGCEGIVSRETYTHTADQLAEANQCEHDGCSQPKKEWSGRGARPKFCAAGHKKEK